MEKVIILVPQDLRNIKEDARRFCYYLRQHQRSVTWGRILGKELLSKNFVKKCYLTKNYWKSVTWEGISEDELFEKVLLEEFIEKA